MKKYLLILLVFTACQKDDNHPTGRGDQIPQEIYGTYNTGITSGSSHWEQTLNITPKDENEVYLIFSGTMFGDTLIAEMADDVIIHTQAFQTSLNIPYTITGTGEFVSPQLVLTLGKSIQTDNLSYNITAIHQ